jgi:hypothetical protein
MYWPSGTRNEVQREILNGLANVEAKLRAEELSSNEEEMTTETVTFYVQVALAGRTGTQEISDTNKRHAIRDCKNLVKNGEFGSAGSVTMTESRGTGPDAKSPKRTLIFQCHMAKTKSGKLALKIDEL